jgi:chromosome segregation ATPase
MSCKDCKHYEKADSQAVLQAKYNGAVSEIRRLSQKNDDLYSTFKILEGNYDRIYDENQRLTKELNDIKDRGGAWAFHYPTITTYLGKSLEYWTDLEQRYNEVKEVNAMLYNNNGNLSERINKALDYLKP